MPAQAEAQPVSDELPPLPEPTDLAGNMPEGYTEEQMQAYAREAVRAAVERERAKWIEVEVSNVSRAHPPVQPTEPLLLYPSELPDKPGLWFDEQGRYYRLAHPVQPTEPQTLEQAADEFADKLRNWDPFGKPPAPVQPTEPVTPTSGNDEVEAECAELVAVGKEMDALGMDRDVFTTAAALLRKQAAQIANLTDRLEMDYRDAQIAELQKGLERIKALPMHERTNSGIDAAIAKEPTAQTSADQTPATLAVAPKVQTP